jgi:hypothetical protein
VTGPPPATPPPPPTPAPPTGGGGSMLGMAPTPPPSGGSDKDNTGGLPTTNIVVPPPPPPPLPPPPPPTPPPTPPDISEITGTDINIVKTITIPKDTTNIHLEFWDNAVIDGDIIDVYIDANKVVSNETLRSKPIKHMINHGSLQQSQYRITMVALNEGSIPPNTALLVIRAFKNGNEYGNSRQEVNMSSHAVKNSNKGVSASVILKMA